MNDLRTLTNYVIVLRKPFDIDTTHKYIYIFEPR